MNVLGIDPGIEITGFGLIETTGVSEQLMHCGIIRTPRNMPLPERLVTLHHDLSQLLAQHPDITACGVEELFFAKNAKTAFAVGQARGVILFTLQRAGVTIIEIKPTHVKHIVTGVGNADKKAIQKMIMLRFHLSVPPQPDDAADAVAVAVAVAGLLHKQSHSSQL